MRSERRTALQGEAIQGLGKALDRSLKCGARKGGPSLVRASQKPEGNQARGNATLGRSTCIHPHSAYEPNGRTKSLGRDAEKLS
ncbi:MAG: hypothetical protein RLZZ408_1694 [Verrucomicrobiota bacterium]